MICDIVWFRDVKKDTPIRGISELTCIISHIMTYVLYHICQVSPDWDDMNDKSHLLPQTTCLPMSGDSVVS